MSPATWAIERNTLLAWFLYEVRWLVFRNAELVFRSVPVTVRSKCSHVQATTTVCGLGDLAPTRLSSFPHDEHLHVWASFLDKPAVSAAQLIMLFLVSPHLQHLTSKYAAIENRVDVASSPSPSATVISDPGTNLACPACSTCLEEIFFSCNPNSVSLFFKVLQDVSSFLWL